MSWRRLAHKLVTRTALWLCRRLRDQAREQEAIDKLLSDCRNRETLVKKTDAETASLLLHSNIYGQAEIGSVEAALVETAIDRLRRARGGSYEEVERLAREIQKRAYWSFGLDGKTHVDCDAWAVAALRFGHGAEWALSWARLWPEPPEWIFACSGVRE